MVFVTASTMTFVQIGFTDSPCGQGSHVPLAAYRLLTFATDCAGLLRPCCQAGRQGRDRASYALPKW